MNWLADLRWAQGKLLCVWCGGDGHAPKHGRVHVVSVVCEQPPPVPLCYRCATSEDEPPPLEFLVEAA